MFHRAHLTIATLIWPGPIDGPHPFTLFKILTPALIIGLGVFPATFTMALISSALALYFYEAIMLEGSSEALNKLVEKLPNAFEKVLKRGTKKSLIPLVLFTGPFPLAISFRFLNYDKSTARVLLVTGSFVNALIWTGIVWGGGLTVLKSLVDGVSLF